MVGSTIKEVSDAPWGLAPGRFSFCSCGEAARGGVSPPDQVTFGLTLWPYSCFAINANGL